MSLSSTAIVSIVSPNVLQALSSDSTILLIITGLYVLGLPEYLGFENLGGSIVSLKCFFMPRNLMKCIVEFHNFCHCTAECSISTWVIPPNYLMTLIYLSCCDSVTGKTVLSERGAVEYQLEIYFVCIMYLKLLVGYRSFV